MNRKILIEKTTDNLAQIFGFGTASFIPDENQEILEIEKFNSQTHENDILISINWNDWSNGIIKEKAAYKKDTQEIVIASASKLLEWYKPKILKEIKNKIKSIGAMIDENGDKTYLKEHLQNIKDATTKIQIQTAMTNIETKLQEIEEAF